MAWMRLKSRSGYTTWMERRAHDEGFQIGSGPDPVGVRELLAVRPGGLADAVCAVPALRHLRATFPDAAITVACTRVVRSLLQACPYVDLVIDLGALADDGAGRYDVVVSFDAPGGAHAIGALGLVDGFTVGWADAGSGSRGRSRPAWPPRLDDTTRMLRLAWLLGGSLQEDTALGLWPSLADRNGAAVLVADISRPIAVVHVGAGDVERRWPSERWSQVLDAVDAAGLEPVLVGTASDRLDAALAASGALAGVTSVVERTSVGELVGLLERAALFVGADSGPAALAGALGVRSVIIGPVSTLQHVARPGLIDLVDAGACSACSERSCEHPPPPVEQVQLEPVLARVERAAATAFASWHRARIA